MRLRIGCFVEIGAGGRRALRYTIERKLFLSDRDMFVLRLDR